MRVIDLSHVIEHGMTTYPGRSGPQTSDHLSFEAAAGTYAPGTEFVTGRIAMDANTGTYLDTGIATGTTSPVCTRAVHAFPGRGAPVRCPLRCA